MKYSKNLEEERNIGAAIKRIIRKEALFGCAVCGNPIIEYHHIIPFHEVRCHEVDNLIALCPTHHYKADRGMIPKAKLYNLKFNPFNNKQDVIKDDFFLGIYDKLEFKLGDTVFIRTPSLIVVDNFPLISITKDEFNNAIMDAKFFDKSANLIAEIVQNEWITYMSEENIWDIQYTGGRLKINSGKKNIFLELQTNPENNLVNLRANMFYEGTYFDIKPSKITYFKDIRNPKEYSRLGSGRMTDCFRGIVINTHL